MENQKKEKDGMIVEYIRKGYRGKRVIKDGAEYVQIHKGRRIGVFVALNAKQFGWSLVHLKGENREPTKNISWGKGVEIALARAKDEYSVFGLTSKVPDSIRKQFDDFKKRAAKHFTEKEFEVKDGVFVVKSSFDGEERCFSLASKKGKGRVNFSEESFRNLSDAIQSALSFSMAEKK